MQSGAPRGRQSCTNWQSLYPELLISIFQKLDFQDKLRAELCCRSWHQQLSQPQVADLWGCVDIDLDKLSSSVVRADATPSQLVLPTVRWLKSRASGMTSLQVKGKHSREVSRPDRRKAQAQILDGGLAMLLTSLRGQKVQMHVDIEVGEHLYPWPVERPPRLQQVLADNLVSLKLDWINISPPEIEGSWGAAGSVPNLKRLTMCDVSEPDLFTRPNAAALNRMRSLQQLEYLCVSDVAELDFVREVLPDLPSLQTVKCEFMLDARSGPTGITGQEAVVLARTLARATRLTCLHIESFYYPFTFEPLLL
ncbi:hypothetical protein WJX73_010585 [Symbiochloris irregularis]|uniref:F-box domain-containing protein n=1 Tax=Symbiochloris irregularis TaxID=706552 RepID=A0AAW1PR01_9CHLO